MGARRPSLLASKKKKPPKRSRSEQYLINLKYLGEEPPIPKRMTEGGYGRALNWYNYMCDVSDAREYLDAYLQLQERFDEIKLLARVPDAWIPLTAAWIARLVVREAPVTDRSMNFLEDRLEESLKKARPVVEKKPPAPVVDTSIDDLIGDIEAKIDSGESFSLYDFLKAKKAPPRCLDKIVARYSPWLDELLEAAKREDKQLREGYSRYPRGWLSKRIKMLGTILDDAERYAGKSV